MAIATLWASNSNQLSFISVNKHGELVVPNQLKLFAALN